MVSLETRSLSQPELICWNSAFYLLSFIPDENDFIFYARALVGFYLLLFAAGARFAWGGEGGVSFR
jgi:hypothetical protein